LLLFLLEKNGITARSVAGAKSALQLPVLLLSLAFSWIAIEEITEPLLVLSRFIEPLSFAKIKIGYLIWL